MSAAPSYGLTPKQSELLRFVGGFLDANGYGPSTEEMRVALGKNNKSSVVRLLQGLEERGRIRRLPNRARAIEVLIPWDFKAEPERVPMPPLDRRKVLRLPLWGRINLNEYPAEV